MGRAAPSNAGRTPSVPVPMTDKRGCRQMRRFDRFAMSLDPTDPVHTLADLERQSFPRHGAGRPRAPHPSIPSARRCTTRRWPRWPATRGVRLVAVLPSSTCLRTTCRARSTFSTRAVFSGLNLTVPHKVIAFDHVAEVEPAARPIGAVNTLLRLEHGWRGYNTDGLRPRHGVARGSGRGAGRMPM